MYWNKSEANGVVVAIMFNNNIGCIETSSAQIQSANIAAFNNNIGCIETVVIKARLKEGYRLITT